MATGISDPGDAAHVWHIVNASVSTFAYDDDASA
jgi:hypothetical protein